MVLENFRKQDITWDKANRKVYENVRVSSEDENGRKLAVQIINDGVVEDLTGFSLSLAWETRDKVTSGLDAFEVVDISKGQFAITYKTGMLQNVGNLNAQLVLIGTDTSKITSENFTITVFGGVGTDGAESSNEFSTLTTALATVNQYDARIESKADKSTTEQSILSLNQQLTENNTSLKIEKDFFYYPITKIPAVDGTDTINAKTIKYVDVIALWDNLLEKYPSYISKTPLGLDTSGLYTIYKYDFINGDSNDYIVMDANIHGDGSKGDPKDATIAIYLFIKDIYDNHTKSGKLAELRWSLNYSIIPVANPWGFDNDSRYNSNGVDCNSNFEWNFDVSGSGISPFSEKESLYIKENLISTQELVRESEKQNKILAYLSIHSFGGSTNKRNPQFPFYISKTTPMRKAFVATSNYLSEKYSYTKFEGVGNASKASADNYAERILGIPSGTPEFTTYRNDGLERTSQAMTQQVEFYGNIILQTLQLNIKSRLKLSLLTLKNDVEVSYVSSEIIKDFKQTYGLTPFPYDPETGKISSGSRPQYIKIKAQLYFEYDASAETTYEETLRLYTGIFYNDKNTYEGTTFDERIVSFSNIDREHKTVSVQLETPPLYCRPNTKYDLRISKTKTNYPLKLKAGGKSWVCVEEVNRYGI